MLGSLGSAQGRGSDENANVGFPLLSLPPGSFSGGDVDTDVTGVGEAATFHGTGKIGQLAFAKGTRGVLITVNAPRGTESRAVAEKAAAKIAPRFE